MTKANHAKDPIAYLWFVGANPQPHGQSVGSAFIHEVIRECERPSLSLAQKAMAFILNRIEELIRTGIEGSH